MNLINGNCLIELGQIPSQSIDLVLADLPYGITQNKWDSEIDLTALWAELKRVRKPTTPIVMFAAQPFTSKLVMSNPWEFKYDWVWRKPKGTGHLNAKKQPMRDKEDIVVFYQSQCYYNPQFSEGVPYKNKAGNPNLATSMSGSYGRYSNYREDNPGRRYPKQVLEFGVVERGTLHPTEKPVDLLRYLIRTYTKPGDTVLDPTMGSGSTGEAALSEGRDFVGIELDSQYYKVALERLRT